SHPLERVRALHPHSQPGGTGSDRSEEPQAAAGAAWLRANEHPSHLRQIRRTYDDRDQPARLRQHGRPAVSRRTIPGIMPFGDCFFRFGVIRSLFPALACMMGASNIPIAKGRTPDEEVETN